MAEAQVLVDRWQGQFQGELIAPHHESYSGACQLWNGMIERKPALVARCTSANDVKTAIKLAHAENLPISVRGGGHNVAGLAICQDGLVIDMSRMKAISVDAEAKELTAQPGVLWGELDAAAEAHGLATTGGQISHTGIAGLTLGGGLGHLIGKFGAVCDNLLSVDLVTANGELVTASEQQNPDLFWAMRGAGANFGVVTSFRYRLHPLHGVLGGLLLHPRARAEEFLAFYQEFLKGTTDDLSTTALFMHGPDGTPLVGVVVVWAGDIAEGERVLQPLRSFGPPVADMIQPMPYTALQSMLDAAVPVGNRYYWKSNFVDAVTPDFAKLLREGADSAPSPNSMILLFEIKGAIRRVPKDAMAFDHRDSNFEMSIIAEWTDAADDEKNIGWARELWTSAQPHVSSAVYSNHMTADETPERIRSAYGAEKYAKLAEIKAKYDPENLFRHNHNIAPSKT